MRGDSADVLVIGAGAIGASAAAHLTRLGVRVLVLEKEQGPARHQSSRNSGVIHAGYNLKPGSLKARYCVEGSRLLRLFCVERGIPWHQGGILVVARSEPECATLAELHRRAEANGVISRIVDEREIRSIEPAAHGLQALHAPEGASFDSRAYVEALLAEAVARGARVMYGAGVERIRDVSLADAGPAPITVTTAIGAFGAAVVVNCAGLYADRLAGSIAHDLRVLPFRGYYAELVPERRSLVQSHIYPPPDLNLPFLGAHLSRRADGRVIVGPGAMLAFGREAYQFTHVNWGDVASTLTWPGFYRLLAQPRFRRLVKSELHKSLSVRAIWKEVHLLVPELKPQNLIRSFAGNRAQLVDRAGRLVDDMVVRETEYALHVLNAVSPGLTCSLPFGAELARRAEAKLGH